MQRYERFLTLFTLLIWGVRVSSSETDNPLRPLVETSAQRLQIAEKVAVAKWYSGTRVEDASREAEVIQKAVKDSESMGLKSTQVEEFFKAQIEANKLIQYSLLAGWQREGRGPEQTRTDLVKEIRPQLDQIEKRLLQELKQSVEARSANTCPDNVAKAVGEYLDSRNLKADSREGVGLDRAMAAACIR